MPVVNFRNQHVHGNYRLGVTCAHTSSNTLMRTLRSYAKLPIFTPQLRICPYLRPLLVLVILRRYMSRGAQKKTVSRVTWRSQNRGVFGHHQMEWHASSPTSRSTVPGGWRSVSNHIGTTPSLFQLSVPSIQQALNKSAHKSSATSSKP